MAARIDRLLEDAVLWNQLRQQSRDLIRRRYTWSGLFANMHRAIDSALDLHAVAPATGGEVASVH